MPKSKLGYTASFGTWWWSWTTWTFNTRFQRSLWWPALYRLLSEMTMCNILYMLSVWPWLVFNWNLARRKMELMPEQSNQRAIEHQEPETHLAQQQVDLSAHAWPPAKQQTSVHVSRSLKAADEPNEPSILTDTAVNATNAINADDLKRQTSAVSGTNVTSPQPSIFSAISTPAASSQAIQASSNTSNSGSESGESAPATLAHTIWTFDWISDRTAKSAQRSR